MKLELTIKTNYLPSWGAYEGLRELIQNGKDAQTEFGATFEVRYRKDTQTLVIENEGCTLPHEALLFGHTTKSERSDLIGKFGEGLKLGVLALVRAGHAVKIRSGSEVWLPKIERSEKFDADVLVFYIEKREAKERVQVEVAGISAEDWGKFEDHFLFLGKLPKDAAVKTSTGALLIGERFEHRVYVKGIFVQNAPDLRFGYDLSTADIDRDRKMVDSFDLKYRTQQIWREAMVTRPDLIDNFVTLLETEAGDVSGLNDWNNKLLPEAVQDAVAKRFTERHGEDAIPVTSLADSKDVEHLGKKGIVCPASLRVVLETKLGTVQDNKAKLAQEVTKTYGWHELTVEEKASIERALFLVNGEVTVALADVDIVDCRDEKILGLHTPEGRVRIVKKILTNQRDTLETMVHEVAHKVGGDGEQRHVSAIERIWSGIVERLTGRTVN